MIILMHIHGRAHNEKVPIEQHTQKQYQEVTKQIPNVKSYRLYTENLCLAAEAAIRSKSEVITFTSKRTFSWLVPGLAFFAAPSVSYFLVKQLGIRDYFPITGSLIAGVFLAGYLFPSMWEPDVPDTIHTIKFPAPD